MITTSQALLEETRFGCVTKASYMHLNISKLRNCHNSCASNHRTSFDSNGQARFGLGSGAGDTYIGMRLARTNAASANEYGVYNITYVRTYILHLSPKIRVGCHVRTSQNLRIAHACMHACMHALRREHNHSPHEYLRIALTTPS